MNSIRTALLRRILAGVVAALLASGAATFLIARASLRGQVDRALTARAETFAALVIEEAIDEDASGEQAGHLIFDFKGSLGEAELGLIVHVEGPDATLLAESPEWPSSVLSDEMVALAGGPVVETWTRLASIDLADGAPARVVAIARHANRELTPELDLELEPKLDPTLDPKLDPKLEPKLEPKLVAKLGHPAHGAPETVVVGGSQQIVVIAVAARMESTIRTERTLLAAIGAGVAFAVFGTALAALLGVGRGLRPLTDMSRRLDGVDPANPIQLPRLATCPSELLPVDAAINALLRRVRETMERERRFSDAAAHELRTPLAELRTVTDVARRWPTEAHRTKAIEQAHAIGRELEELIESLLALSREHASVAPSASPPLALLPLVREIVGLCGSASERRIAISIDGAESDAWTLPRSGVAAIFRNLIENALAYTADGGEVRISVAARASRPQIRIENGPVTLQTSDIEHMFEPFWRGDASRTGRGHRGLGLTIVDALCCALKLERRSFLEAGQVFRIELAPRGDGGAGLAVSETPA